MTRHLSIAAVAALTLGTTLLAQGFNIRTGTWQFTMTMGGALPMEGIPPNMRAQFEAEMRKPKTYNSCVSPEDLKNLNLGKEDDSDDDNCKVLSLKVTPAVGDVVRQCGGNQPHTDTMHFEASGPQAVTATISSKHAQGTTTMAITGKWVSAQCKE